MILSDEQFHRCASDLALRCPRRIDLLEALVAASRHLVEMRYSPDAFACVGIAVLALDAFDHADATVRGIPCPCAPCMATKGCA